ncbi:hypothetical protein [Kitasatospora camelliae]|uniref:Uncharacterized protein n=1 Tax=Kitasatospora camelliae TaxID=3156397 RepID=A0AAU8JS74_9ACTN
MSFGHAPRPKDGSLIAVGFLGLLQLVIELAVLVYDFSQAGPEYVSTALGISYDHYVRGPVGFFSNDTALVVALAVVAVGAFSGRRWARPTAVAVLGVNAFSSLMLLVNQLVSDEAREHVVDGLDSVLLNLTLVAAVLIALACGVVVAATGRPAAPAVPYAPPFGAAPYGGPFAPPAPAGPYAPPVPGPFPGPAQPAPAPQAAAPQAQAPQAQAPQAQAAPAAPPTVVDRPAVPPVPPAPPTAPPAA